MTEQEVSMFIHDAFGDTLDKVVMETPSPVTSAILAGLMHRESAGGKTLVPPGPVGKGDNGHGHGLCQIDDRYYPRFCANPDVWGDPYRNIKFAKQLLEHNYDYFKLHIETATDIVAAFPVVMQTALSAYNAGIGGAKRGLSLGKGSDYFTTGSNYGQEVMRLASVYSAVVRLLKSGGSNGTFGSAPASI